MSHNYNHCTLIGRLTRDPQLKQISNSFSKLTFILAVGRKHKRDIKQTETDFIPVCVFGNNAMIGKNLLKKGDPVLIWGSIQVRSYLKNNERKWITEVVADNFQLLGKSKKQNLVPESFDDPAISDVEALTLDAS